MCALVLGCGGEQAAQPAAGDAGAVVDPCAAEKRFTTHVLMEFNSGPPHGWIGGDGAMSPPVGNKLTPSPLAEPRCGESGYALHVVATGSTLGPSVELKFSDNNLPPFDATGYTGLSFWARRGSDDSGRALLATIRDAATTGDSQGVCSDAGGDRGKCDAFGRAVGLSPVWQLYLIPFATMRQKGYGTPEDGIDLTSITGFKISSGPGDWDFWLDEIAIYKEGAP